MELHVLRNFIVVVQEEGVTAAADVLGISQPALSRQLKELERELGAPLFVRANRSRMFELTEQGRLMYRRAQEITELADRARCEIADGGQVSGVVHIAGAQSAAMRIVGRAARTMRERHPHVSVQLHDDYGANIVQRLDDGLADFGVMVQPVDLSRYDSLPLAVGDRMGLLMRADHPLAVSAAVAPRDLVGVPIIVPQGVLARGDLSGWFGRYRRRLEIVGTMNLMYNASCLVQEGYACAIGPEGMVDCSPDSGLCFRPLEPAICTRMCVAWKRSPSMSRAACAFLEALRDTV